MKIVGFDYTFKSSARLDIGRRRKANQDRVIECAESGLFGVSDGMGGLDAGGMASELIARELNAASIRDTLELTEYDEMIERAGDKLKALIHSINFEIFSAYNTNEYIAAGATLCVALLISDCALFLNIGDSRGYILKKSGTKLKPVTTDHNLAALLVEAGQLTREEARTHPSSSRLTRFMGMPEPCQFDIFVEKLDEGDMLLLCSDGLYGMLKEDEIARIMRGKNICEKLTEAANNNGGLDNISCVVVEIGE